MSGLSQVPMAGNQKARRNWGRAVWAFILCIPNPGIGLVYARRWTLGVTVGGVMLAIQVLLLLLTERLDPTKDVLLILLGLGGLIAVMSLGFAIGAAWLAGLETRRPRGRWWKSTWVAAGIIMFLQVSLNRIFPSGWRGFSLPSSSNMPSLMTGDVIMADIRPSYRPARGDMMLFLHKNREVWIKRVIGLPGDRIVIANGIVSINGHPAPRTDASSYPLGLGTPGSAPDQSIHALRYTEILPEGFRHPILAQNDGSQYENVDEVVVPAHAYYVLGDNRDNSEDSRMPEVGFISERAVVGKARLIYWSRDRSRILASVR